MWYCRAWTCADDGWTNEFFRFETEECARAFGDFHVSLNKEYEHGREYEVIKEMNDALF